MTDLEIAEAIAAAINEQDYTANVWEKEGYTRVYVTRELSRGRRQEMGFIAIDDGVIEPGGMNRAKATINQIAIDAI